MGIAADRTRTLIERYLGVSLAPDAGEAYRDAQGAILDGEWLGAYAQPGVLLNTVSAVSASLSEAGGAMVDEYGRSEVVIVSRRDDRLELRKSYTSAAARQFVYVGRLGDGTFAGYWYSMLRPQFRGVFYFVRADRLSAAVRQRVSGSVRTWSWRKPLTLALVIALWIACIVGFVRGRPEVCVSGLVAQFALTGVLRRRMATFRAEVERWRSEL